MLRRRFRPLRIDLEVGTSICTILFVLMLGAGTAGAEPKAPAKVAETATPAAAPQVGDAIATIEALHVDLLAVMKDADGLGYRGREQKLAESLPRHFDVEFMARKSLGRYWTQSVDPSRALYLETFERFMVANYAGRFDGYSGQSFAVDGHEPAGKGTVLVRTHLNNPKGDDVELKYRLRPVNGGWKIIDVFLDGTVSELALRYSEFVSIVKRENLEALIAALDARIDKLASEGGDAS